MNKIKSSIDKRHKDFIKNFNNEQNEIENINIEINQMKKELENLQNLNINEIDKKIINEKTKLLDKIKKLENDKKSSKNNEILYYNNSIDYLTPYYENKKIKSKECNINDFFNSYDNFIIDNKVELLENFNKSIDNKQIIIGKNNKFKPKYCKDINCNSELTLHISDGYLICINCGYCEEIIVDSDKPNYKEPVSDATSYSYKRINHFNELKIILYII